MVKMKLWIAISKKAYKSIYQGEVTEHFETSTARESLETLKQFYSDEDNDYFEIERNKE